MSNLRRHLNFVLNKPLPHHAQGIGNTTMKSASKSSFFIMPSDLYNCLDICSSYIQALNTLCGAGTLLAQNFLKVFNEVPSHWEVASQFLNAWDEISKATAGASAAVKTETLMSLQDILNRLEEGENKHMDGDGEIDAQFEHIHAIGLCLLSYVELQAQFSLAAWKALSQITRNFSSDRFTQREREAVVMKRHDSQVPENFNLSVTIRKHFGQVLDKLYTGSSKPATVESIHSQFSTHGQISSCPSMNLGEKGRSPAGLMTPNFTWSNSNFYQTGSLHLNSESSQIEHSKDTSNELDEVINLLSWKPVKHNSSSLLRQMPTVCDFDSNSEVWKTISSKFDSRELTTNHSAVHIFPDANNTMSSSDGKKTWPQMNNHNVAAGFSSINWIWTENPKLVSCIEPDQQTRSQLNSENCSFSQNTHSLVAWQNAERERWNTMRKGENSCSSDDASSINGQDSDVFSFGLDFVGRELVASVRQRRHSSSDGVPDPHQAEVCNTGKGTDLNLDDRFVKTSTWPLKQTSIRFPSSFYVVTPPVSHVCEPQVGETWLSSVGRNSSQGNVAKKYCLFGQPS